MSVMMIFKVDTHVHKLVSYGLRETSGVPMTESGFGHWQGVQLWEVPLFWQLGSSSLPLTRFVLGWQFLLDDLWWPRFYLVYLLAEASHESVEFVDVFLLVFDGLLELYDFGDVVLSAIHCSVVWGLQALQSVVQTSIRSTTPSLIRVPWATIGVGFPSQK